MRSSKVTSSKVLGLALIAGVISATAFAEPTIQPDETLESLSQAKITTTVNGQPGSLQELAASGKIKILGEANTNAAEEAPASEVMTEEVPASETEATQEAPTIDSSAENPVNAELAAPAN